MNKKYRHEYKHYINYPDYLELTARLKYITKKDPFSGQNGTYRVRSLYFDNYQDKALQEKLTGLSKREKFRIRYYNEDASVLFLEKKEKDRGLCLKQKTRLSVEECSQIISGNNRIIKNSENPLLLELYSKMNYQQLRPKIIVDYKREAYVFTPGNVRITIDSDIRSSSSVSHFLDHDFFGVPISNKIILEVKYDEFLPQIISDLVQLPNRQAAAFSKYAAARIF